MLIQERQDIVTALVALGQERGFLTLDQVLDNAPADLDVEEVSALLQELEGQGIEVEGAEQVQPDIKRRPASRVNPAPARNSRCRCTRRTRDRIWCGRTCAR